MSVTALRRHVVAWQGFAARFRSCDARGDALVECVRRLSCAQLDSIAIVERSHLLVLGSRVGAVSGELVSRLLGEGRLFEYWAHEACLLPSEEWPLYRRRMLDRAVHHWWGPVIDGDPKLAARVLSTIRERGPLASRDFDGERPNHPGGMWNLKPAKKMLDALWTAGRLVVRERRGFERHYDLPERVLPRALLCAPVSDEESMLRGFAERAVTGRGALTASGVANHFRLRGGVARITPHLDALVRAGTLRKLDVDDGGAPVYLPASAPLTDDSPTAKSATAVLLSPFENLLWDRAFAQRLFGFDHLIEVFKPAPQRAFGYYVLPLLVGDRLLGRVDLKSHRREGALRVLAVHREPGVRVSAAFEESLTRALVRLARTLDLTCETGVPRRGS